MHYVSPPAPSILILGFFAYSWSIFALYISATRGSGAGSFIRAFTFWISFSKLVISFSGIFAGSGSPHPLPVLNAAFCFCREMLCWSGQILRLRIRLSFFVLIEGLSMLELYSVARFSFTASIYLNRKGCAVDACPSKPARLP